jgi:hypothetical protein
MRAMVEWPGKNHHQKSCHSSLSRGRLIALVSSRRSRHIRSSFLYLYAKEHKEEFAAGGLAIFEKVSRLLPLEADTKKEIETINTIASRLTEQDDRTWTFLLLLQNNSELRPGGGFLGQYGVLKIKEREDRLVLRRRREPPRPANHHAKVTPPWQLTRYLQLKRWKFRDSNFSPDFAENAAKAEYFYRLGGGREQFDGVIAVNAGMLDRVIGVTGPYHDRGVRDLYTAENASLKASGGRGARLPRRRRRLPSSSRTARTS